MQLCPWSQLPCYSRSINFPSFFCCWLCCLAALRLRTTARISPLPLEKAAKELRASNSAEIVVQYETLDSPNQSYYVEITPSLDPSWARQDVWGSYLVVSARPPAARATITRSVPSLG